MSVPFEIPEWLMPPAPPPPDTSTVDPHRIEGLVNRFIAAKQDALFTGPDAYYRSEGRDAIMLLPFIKDRLTGLKDEQFAEALPDYPQTRAGVTPESLIQPLTEGERAVLGERLDAHIAEALDGINRHAAKQRDVLNRQTLAERQRLIQNAATLEHSNDDKLDGLAEANAGAAFELARMTGQPEGPAMDAARSSIWQTAINQRLANGDGAGALGLFERAQHQLAPADRRSLDTLLQAVRHDQAANQWIARQTATDGPPLLDRIARDPDLPADAKFIVRAKLHARDSTQESERTAAVRGLNDQIADTTRLLATTPGTYKTGTLARIADAYAAASEPGKAESTRRLALQESALASFAQASADKQQRMIDELAEGELRDTAMAIQRHQAEAFAKDAFAAGTTLYPEVGPPLPIDDIQGRIRQAREIAGRRGIPVMPFTADEITGIRRILANGSSEDRRALLNRVNALPDDMNAALAPLLLPPRPRETASDIPADGPALHRDGALVAQAEPDQPQPANTDGEAGQSYGIDAQRSMEALQKLHEEEAAGAAENRGGQGMVPPTEPAPGSPEYQAADTEARQIVAEQEADQRVTDRLISAWMASTNGQSEMPPALARRLEPDQRRQLENMVDSSADTETDSKVLARIKRGLTSYNSQVRLKWARDPLYRFRGSLSAKDFAKVATLQNRLDPHTGRVLGSAPIPDDLQPLYDALAPDPESEYGTVVAVGEDGRVRPVMPMPLRSFLKGILDLFAAEKTGELTPDAIGSLVTAMNLAGQTFGPRGGAETLAAGGKRRPFSEAEKLRRAEQLEANKTKGRAWERDREAFYAKEGLECTTQITIKTLSGSRGRVDCLFYDRNSKLRIKEFKASPYPYIRRRQREFFAELERFGGTVMGKGKDSFQGGTKVPKTKVEIEAKPAEAGNVHRPNRHQ